jgi:hypothetical protein
VTAQRGRQYERQDRYYEVDLKDLAKANDPEAFLYSNSLIVLYRLLFVLYAEARELLPLRESPAYRDQYSLYSLVRDVARRLDSGVTLLTDTGQTCDMVK